MLPVVDRKHRVSFNLLGPTFHHPDNYTFPGIAVATQSGVPVVLALDQVLREADRALNVEFPFPYTKAFASHCAYSSHTCPSQEISAC